VTKWVKNSENLGPKVLSEVMKQSISQKLKVFRCGLGCYATTRVCMCVKVLVVVPVRTLRVVMVVLLLSLVQSVSVLKVFSALVKGLLLTVFNKR